MPTEAQAPVAGMPDFDPNADRGSDFTPEGATAAQVVELTADELKAIGKATAEPAKEPAKTDAATDPSKPAEAAKEPEKKEGDEAKKPEGEDKPRDEKGKFIPKARFDEVNTRAKAKVAALEAKIATLEARVAPAEGAPDTAALEKALDDKSAEYTKLVADGELDQANAVLREVNRLNRQIASVESALVTGQHSVETQNVDTLGQLVDLYKEAYPVFDDGQAEVYNQEAVDFVAKLQGRFEATGSSPAEALREAVELAVLKFGLDPEPEAAAEAAKPADKGAERKTAAVDAALKAEGAQPPSTSKVGTDSDKVGMSKISVEQIADMATFTELAKNESTLKRLRGDFA